MESNEVFESLLGERILGAGMTLDEFVIRTDKKVIQFYVDEDGDLSMHVDDSNTN